MCVYIYVCVCIRESMIAVKISVHQITLLMFQPFRHFTYVTAHSATFPPLYLRHSSFSNPSVASPTSLLIFQPFFLFSSVTGSSLTSSGEPQMLLIELKFYLLFIFRM